MARLDDLHAEPLSLRPSLLLASVQATFGACHRFVSEDQFDSIRVDTPLSQRRTTAVFQTMNMAHRFGDRRLVSSNSRFGRNFTVLSKQPIDLPLTKRSAFLLTNRNSDGSLLRRRSFSHTRSADISQSAGRPRCRTIGCTVFKLLFSRWIVISWLFQFKSPKRSLAISWLRRPWVNPTINNAGSRLETFRAHSRTSSNSDSLRCLSSLAAAIF